MTFTGYLDINEINDLTAAGVQAGVLGISRLLLVAGIDPMFMNALPQGNSPMEQFNLDLVNLSGVERLANGQVPLVQFLQNVAAQLRMRQRVEADLFERVASRIGNRTQGVRDLPPPAQVPEEVQQEAIIGLNDMVPVGFLAQGARMAGSVARIMVPRFEQGVQAKTANGVPWLMAGTGWVIGKDLVITNHHVINARRDEEPPAAAGDFALQGAGAHVEFGYDADGAPKTVAAVKAVVRASAQLDYAILRLAANAGRPPLPVATSLFVHTPATYASVNIIQHAQGAPKKVAFRNNLIAGADQELIRYYTDTDRGSSGSPVFDDDWRVLALHRGARRATGVTYQGKKEAYVNFGSQLARVLEDVKAGDPSLHTEIINAQPN